MQTSKPQWCDRRLIVNPYHVALCLSEEAFEATLTEIGVPPNMWPDWIKAPWSDATAHIIEHKDTRLSVVCMRGWEGRNPIEVAGLLVHEAVHIWQEVCDIIGERHPSAEFEAYSIQAIAQDLMQGFVDATSQDPPPQPQENP